MFYLLELLEATFLLVGHLSSRTSFPKPLAPAEEAKALAALRAGDPDAAKRLIEHNLRLVAHIAKKYQRANVDQDDLVSIGAIGLMKAVWSFKPEAGRLTAYAARCIENEILMALRAGKKLRANCSLNEPIGSDAEGNEVMLADILGTDPELVPDQALTGIEAARALRLMQRVLDSRERAVLTLRYGLLDATPRAQHEVADTLAISRSYVSRIEKKALAKLRAAMNGENPRDFLDKKHRI